MRAHPAICIFLALASTAAAQRPLLPITAVRATGVIVDAGRIDAVGPRYRVRFAAGATEFVPALGAAAAEPQTLRLELATARRGDRAFWSGDREVPAQPSARDDRVEYRHGDGALVERWTPRDDGVELSFVFPRQPEGDGDLVVALRLQTPLPAHDTEWRSEGLELVAPGVGGVTIGAVTGIDADGRSAAGALRLHDGHLELSLPERFVTTARYPLVLDPLIGGKFAVGGTGADNIEPALAYDKASQTYLALVESRFAIGVSDVIGLRFDRDGNTLGGPLLISGASIGLKAKPAAGSADQVGMFLVAWQESEFLGAQSDVRARLVRGSDGTMGSVFSVSATSDDETDPDIATAASGTRTVIVWAQHGSTHGIRARRITMPSTIGTPLPGPVVSLGTGSLDALPAISQNGGAAGRFAVAWRTGTNEIRARLVDDLSNPLGGEVIVIVGGSRPVDRPDVDGDGTDFLVVFDQKESTSAGATRDVLGRKLSYDGANFLTASAVLPVAAIPGADEVEPAIAFLGPKYVALWSRRVSGLDYDIHGINLTTADCSSCGVGFSMGSFSRPRQSAPQVASRRASGEGSSECLLAWSEADIVPPFQSNVVAQVFEAQVGLPAVVVSPGCAGGGSASAISPFVFGNDNFHFQVKRADPSTFAFAFDIGFPGPGIPCGSCDFMSPVVQFIVAPTIGPSGASAVFHHRPSCDPAYLGLVLDFQWIAVGTTTAPCPLVAGIAASERLRVTLAP